MPTAAGAVAVVGEIPHGLPRLSLHFLAEDGWLRLLAPAAMIAIIGYVESISVAKALAFRRQEKIDPDRELLALGSTNLIASVAGAMPVAGGFARSMVNYEAGARTQLAAVVTALWVALAALLFTGLLAPLPEGGAGGDHRRRGLAAGRFRQPASQLALRPRRRRRPGGNHRRRAGTRRRRRP